MSRCLLSCAGLWLAALVLPVSGFAAETLPHSTIATGDGTLREVRFIDPTERYQHCVLGDCVEAGGIEATLRDGTTATLRLDTSVVFEDLVPRIVPLGENGGDAILVVKAYASSGGALALLEVVNGKLVTSAEGPAIGTPNRWQNPVGVADFDGDGVHEIATVITPHIGGILTLYERRGGRLVKDHQIRGFSNHALGSKNLGLSVMTDVNGDGLADIILPDMTRRSLVPVFFDSPKPRRGPKVTPDGSLDHDFEMDGDGFYVGGQRVSLDDFRQ